MRKRWTPLSLVLSLCLVACLAVQSGPAALAGSTEEQPDLAAKSEAVSGEYYARVEVKVGPFSFMFADDLHVMLRLGKDGSIEGEILNPDDFEIDPLLSSVLSNGWRQYVPLKHWFAYTWEDGNIVRVRRDETRDWFGWGNLDHIDFQVFDNERGTAVFTVVDIPIYFGSPDAVVMSPTFTIYAVKAEA